MSDSQRKNLDTYKPRPEESLRYRYQLKGTSRRSAVFGQVRSGASDAVWYHGGVSGRKSFYGQKMDRDRTTHSLNAAGPGIYLTRDAIEASGYASDGGSLYEVLVDIPPSRMLTESQEPSSAVLAKFLQLLPQESLELGYSNWDENPIRARKRVLSEYPRTAENLHDMLLSVRADFMPDRADAWAVAVVRLGYDAALVNHGKHLVVLNPDVITTQRELLTLPNAHSQS